MKRRVVQVHLRTWPLALLAALAIGCNGSSGPASVPPAVAPGSPPPGFSTNFDLTEAPISESGAWHRANNPWTNVNTGSGIAFGTNGAANTYDDSYALLSGFGPNQQASAVVARSASLNTAVNHEMELLLRFSDSATTARGYECLFNAGGAVDIVRWNGTLGDFTSLQLTAGALGLGRDLVSGDVIKATIVGNVISTYVNGVLMAQGTDSTYSTGQPGIGFFTRPGGNTANFGMTSYTASTLP
jgi:hypothetical protein